MADSILSDFVQQTPQTSEDDFARRRKAKADRVLTRARNILQGVIQARNEAMQDFWTNTDGISPKAIVAELGPAKSLSLFAEAASLDDYIASRLKAAGADDAYIAKVIPPMSSQYTVSVTADGVTIEDRIE